jgi:hypothetical protein
MKFSFFSKCRAGFVSSASHTAWRERRVHANATKKRAAESMLETKPARRPEVRENFVECLNRLRQRCPELPEDCKAFWEYFCVKYPEHIFKKHHTGLVSTITHTKGGFIPALAFAFCDFWTYVFVLFCGPHRAQRRMAAGGLC